MPKFKFALIGLIFLSCESSDEKESPISQPKIDSTTDNIEVVDSSTGHISPSEVYENDTLFEKYDSKYSFEDFECKVYDGKLATPIFENNPYAEDPEYVSFIRKGCEENGINYAGKYTVIHKACGAFCEHIFIVNREDGTIFTGEFEPNNGGRYGYDYRANSQLIIANSEMFPDPSHEYILRFPPNTLPEFYVLKANDFDQLE
ncbi:MAG: hypothetical protein HUJ25_02690 [Crocinitomicaceae bacterium]|nr:hypothetical protein [Crocinitomicaceae bacterium]